MVMEARAEILGMETEARAIGATLTAALLGRLDLPEDREQAADVAVGLFWRVVWGLLSESPEQARPAAPDFAIQENAQP